MNAATIDDIAHLLAAAHVGGKRTSPPGGVQVQPLFVAAAPQAGACDAAHGGMANLLAAVHA